MIAPDFSRSDRACPMSSPDTLKFSRVLLKLSGEALMGEQSYGLDAKFVHRLASEIQTVHAMGAQIAIVVGGGNIFRGIAGAAAGMERATADYMGMLATVINSLALQSALERQGVPTRVQSAISMQSVCEAIFAAAPSATWRRGGW